MPDILVIGSVAIDQVVHLDAPLRNGAHNAGRYGGERIGGGAANTAMALARGGLRARIISTLGADSEGERLISQLAGLGVETALIDRTQPKTTRSLVLINPNGERTIVNLSRAPLNIPKSLGKSTAGICYVRSADPALRPLIQTLTEDYRVIAHIPPITTAFRPAHILLGSASDLPDDFLSDPFAKGCEVAGPRVQWVVITEGAKGASAYAANAKHSVSAAAVPDPVDTTGAGDVFAAGLCQALARGVSFKDALGEAVAWGTASIGYSGTVPPEDFLSRVGALAR